MVQKLRERSQGEGGFTLVELLVVMLILGLLAAIAIPSFFNQREKAKDADAKAAARTAQTAIETYATGNQGTYTGATSTVLRGDRADPERLGPVRGRRRAWAATATPSPSRRTVRPTTMFSITRNADGTTDLTCTDAGDDGCPAAVGSSYHRQLGRLIGLIS